MHVETNKRNVIIEYILIISALLYYIDIFLVSRLTLNSVLRVQDMASVLSFLIVYYIIKNDKKDGKKNYNNLLLMLIFVLYMVIGNFIFYLKGNIDLNSIFYIGKNIEFYLCFIIISYFFRIHTIKAYKIFEITIMFIVIYGFYQLLIGKISYYGIGTMFETAPSTSGSIYFVSSTVSFYLYKMIKKSRFRNYAILTYILTILTISKTNIIGLTLFYIIFFTLEISHKVIVRNNKYTYIKKDKILIIMAFLILILTAILFVIYKFDVNRIINENNMITKIIDRFNRLGSSYSFRSNKAGYYLEYFIKDSPLILLFGSGKGITEYAFKVKTLAVDNQYVRAIIELGIIGIIIWTSVVVSILKSLKRLNVKYVYHLGISLFISYLAMAIGYEVFVVTKTGIVFWFLMGIFNSNLK